jgi:hypothetical protein
LPAFEANGLAARIATPPLTGLGALVEDRRTPWDAGGILSQMRPTCGSRAAHGRPPGGPRAAHYRQGPSFSSPERVLFTQTRPAARGFFFPCVFSFSQTSPRLLRDFSETSPRLLRDFSETSPGLVCGSPSPRAAGAPKRSAHQASPPPSGAPSPPGGAEAGPASPAGVARGPPLDTATIAGRNTRSPMV